MRRMAALLREEQPEVGLLINASGFGKFRAVMDTPLEVNLNMVDLNCKAVMALASSRCPYMPSGSQIINIASVAAFQPSRISTFTARQRPLFCTTAVRSTAS